MSDRLPPLTALRAFEAAARHMSFAKAADELNVTPAALSFQIKSLEEHLGAQVFRRLNRAVELTAEGRALQGGVSEGFDLISGAWRAARRVNRSNVLTVTSGPAFTAKWLAPRLFQFAQAHPGIDLRFAATLRLLDFDRDEIDVAIRFGKSSDKGLFSKPILYEWLSPAMTPEMAEIYTTPESLLDAPLIFDDSIGFLNLPLDWATWFRANGIDTDHPPGAHFSQADHAIDAALSGGGVVLGRSALAAFAVQEGKLVAPFDIALRSEAHWRFVCPPGHQDKPQVADFLTWLEEEIARTMAHLPDKTLITATDLK